MFTYNKYLTKMIVFTVGLSTMPIILLGLFFYIKTSGTVQEKVNQGNVLILEQTHLRIEQVLGALDLQIERLAESPFVAEALEEGITPSRFMLVQQLHRSMSQVQTFDIGIRDVHLIDLNRGTILNSDGLNPLSPAEAAEIARYRELDRTKFWAADSEGWLQSEREPSFSIHLVKKVPAFAERPSGMLVIDIPGHQLRNYLIENNALGEILVLDANYQLLTAQNESVIEGGAALDGLIARLKASDDASGLYETSFGGKHVGVAYQRSTFNGWIYISVIPIELVRLESRQTGALILAASIAMLLLAVVISLAGSHRMYTPIQRLYQSLFAQSDKGRKRLDEFRVIHEGFASMRKTQLEMADSIRSQTRQLEEYYVLKLIRGEIAPTQIYEKLEFVHVDATKWKQMALLTIQIDTLRGTRYSESDSELLLFAINNIVSELVPEHRRLRPIVADSFQVTLVFDDPNANEDFRTSVYSLANRIQEGVESCLALRVSIGVSRMYGGLKDAKTAYREARDALKYRVLYGQKTILRIDDVQPAQSVATQYPKELERQVLDAVKMADREGLPSLLDAFFKDIAGQYHNYNDYQIAVTRFFVNLIRLLQESGVPQLEPFGGEPPRLEQLHALASVQDVRDWFERQLIGPMMRVFEEQRTNRHRTISQEVVEMIHRDFDTDLTLESCSHALNYHPSYISKVLRQELGISFSDYLLRHRIQKAKEMLEETDLKVSEIAEKLGYNNSQNFIRSFRKLAGTTPGAYREEFLQDRYKAN
ncbi:helix-turn-helix domain-containing protein [Paenibacillus antri]|uniref:Helix-turn-helix domain-containing protein n=1 Tax=Paenibacillus antri TaxID=2582848 RepID=A0A5R9GHC0_9BACL|nr:helix-turn-helix domain-containing protein [Paenibacillus antri]TLS53856.1 helix-turn-helix domain-containing protein [Paenibacillus antri]